MAASPQLEVRHKGQQSADSGAYLEWSAEDSTTPQERSYQSNVTGEFVTVVAVEQTALERESTFVTVVSIGDKKEEVEEVLVYRLPGERLGFGLKFEGGLKTTERVNRLFIQSCAPDSPASRTRCSWGPLAPGDEIIEIDGVEVKDMTRIDCVRSLKESNVVIKLKVKQQKNEDKEERKSSSPPPIPPRKVPRRNSAQKEPAIVNPPDGFADDSSKELKSKTASPKVLIKNNYEEKQTIPEAEVYLDLIAKESEIIPESESDDTGSSISTVVDRLSSAPTTSNSSFSDVRSITSLDITTPPTPTTNTCPTFDLDRVLEPFLQLEREFSSSATIDESSLFNKLVAAANFTEPSHISVTRSSSMNSGNGGEDSHALQPPVSFQDEPGNRANFDGERHQVSAVEIFEPVMTEKSISLKTSPRKSHNIVLNLCAENDQIPATKQRLNSYNKEEEDEDEGQNAPALPPKPTPRKDIGKNKFKSGKKRPPPPPPPRSDRPICPDPHENTVDSKQEVEIDPRPEIDHHLPRLIDFVPKDRTDLVIPNAIHPENSQQNHMEILIQRQRLLEMMKNPDVKCEDVNVDSAQSDGSECEEEEHCATLPMCVPVEDSDEESQGFEINRNNNLTTIGEDDEDTVDAVEAKPPPVPTIEEPSAEPTLEDEPEKLEPQQPESSPLAIATPALNATDQPPAVLPEKAADKGECGAMDASATASLTSLSPPPSFSRLPPDGHEFPPNYQETCPEPVITPELSLKMQPPPPLPSSAPPIPKKKLSAPSLDRDIGQSVPVRKYSSCSNPSNSGNEDVNVFIKSSKASMWRNDEKSVRSVRDKIAMFSNVTDETPISPAIAPPSLSPHRKLNRFKSSEDVFYSNDCVDSSGSLPTGKLFSRSVISVDKVASNSYMPEVSQRSMSPMKKIPTYSSMVDMSQMSCNTKQIKPNTPKNLEYTSRTQSSMDLSSVYSPELPDPSLNSAGTPPIPYLGYSSTLPRKASRESERKSSLTTSPTLTTESKTNLGRAMSFNGTSKLHSRSQSLVDVNSIPVNRYVPKNNSEEARRASLNALIEQRRRSISKLRGLVIPEKVSEDVVPQTIPDLPEIKSRDSILSRVPEEPIRKSSFSSCANNRLGNVNSNYSNPATFGSSVAQNNISSLAWKTQSSVPDIPKYSPAFKRKSLAVYGTPSVTSSVSSSLSSSREELRPIFDNSVGNSAKTSVTTPPPPSKPPRSGNSNLNRNNLSSPCVTSLSPTPSYHEPPKSLESITSPTQSDVSFEFFSSSGSSPDIKMMRNNQYEERINQRNGSCVKANEPQVMPLIKLNKHQSPSDLRRSGGEESDNDSAVSSSRSSISHDFSPPQSPIPDIQHRIGDDDNRSHLLLSPSNSAGSSDRRTLRRTLSSETTASAASSTASTLTSGSQASCSSSSTDSLNRRVLKAQSVEAINRKNVLSSARFSSGQDLKIGSPLIQRKFEENDDFSKEDITSQTDLINDSKMETEAENFIEKLNGTLKKDVVTQVLNEENISSEIIHYQLSSPKKEFRTTKIAYLEVDMSDGGNFSSQDDSSFIDSNPSSMEHLDNDPIPAPREKSLVKENGFSNQETIKGDFVENKVDYNSKLNSEIYNIDSLTNKYNQNYLDNSPTKKPFIKRLSRENCNNNGSSTSDDDSCKTAYSQNNIETPNVAKQHSVSVVPPKPAERKGNTQALLHSDSKESTTSSEDFMSCTSKQETPTLSPKESPSSSSTGKIPTIPSKNVNRRSVSVNDIRKAFEKAEIALSGKPKPNLMNGNGHLIPSHARVSSLDSTTSEDSCAPTPTHYGSITNLQKEQQFGSITSLASSTSLISQQELQQLIEDANQTLEEAGGCSHEVVVVILHRDTAGGSVGITLAGGADYEAKEITVHKVLAGSPADRDGRIQKGDRILSINGRSMKGVSHRESLAILKAPRPEVVLVVSRWRPDGYTDPQPVEDPLVLSLRNNLRPPRIPEQSPETPTDSSASDKEETVENVSGVARGPPLTVTLVKDGAGLGFSLEGGKDSPIGDQPLTIKKIFTGGCAEKSGQLFAGDELLSVNNTDVTSMSRIEAWGLMKRLADGRVVLTLRHKAVN